MNRFQIFRRSASRPELAKAHMTWGSASVGRTVARTGLFLKKQLWIFPIIAVVVLLIVGFVVSGAIEATMKANLRSELQTLLTAETTMLQNWCELKATNAETLASQKQVREAIYPLLAASAQASPDEAALTNVDAFQTLSEALVPVMSSNKFVGYFVADRSQRIVASSYPMLIGQQEVTEYEGFVTRALDGKTVVSAPFASVMMLKNGAGQVRMGEPTMYVCAPVRDADFQVVATLALQLRPEREFTQILQLGQIGESGETYAFNDQGVMISNSRFDHELILLGLLPDHDMSRSILNVMIRDPQCDMTQGERPQKRRSELPLTRMVARAIAGESGVDVDGYRDYRGVEVVGAWRWLPEYEMGVATEIDVAEAFRPLSILKQAFGAMYALLILSAVAVFVFTVVVARLQREARKAAIEAQQLGQYSLKEKIGQGAMGVVYKGEHAMMQRPTAIKLLDVEKVNETSIERFEREVQITCRLNHPSTVEIYDYGRTPEGVFYYAMEYLDGINLQALVERYGPIPPGRVIHLLTQVCGSLYEAHSLGLVHRDIKPANIMLNRRGGEPDVVKVLDFGLVKAIDAQQAAGATGVEGLTGTPLYMSPEAIQAPASIDGRSDLYGVGAVGYFLLTAKTVFDADTLVSLCQKQIDEVPVTPSVRLGKELSGELENAIMSCLEKSRAKRPQTARDLAQLLSRCPETRDWSIDAADAWWGRHERRGGEKVEPASHLTAVNRSGYDQTQARDL